MVDGFYQILLRHQHHSPILFFPSEGATSRLRIYSDIERERDVGYNFSSKNTSLGKQIYMRGFMVENRPKTWLNKIRSFILQDTGSGGLTDWKDATTLDFGVIYHIQWC